MKPSLTTKRRSTSDFISHIRTARTSTSRGLSCGIKSIDKAINLIQPGQSIAVAASNKVGKSKWVREVFVLGPYLEEYIKRKEQGLEPKNIKGFYYSLESSIIEVMGDCTAYLCHKLYGSEFDKETILGRKVDNEGEPVRLTKEELEVVETCVVNYIEPLFGVYQGEQKVKDGIWDIITQPENPTGVWKELLTYAESIGEIKHQNYKTKNKQNKLITKKRISGFQYKEQKNVIVIIDDVRLLSKERGFNRKENIDKWCEYTIMLCELFKFTIVNIVHTNREEASLESLKYYGSEYYPTEDVTKDSGNIGERMKIVFTLLNPVKYKIKVHMGKNVSKYQNRYRSVHLVLSRDTPAPVHFQTKFKGEFSTFEYL